LPSSAMVINKPAQYVEVEKKQIIEEVQSVIYKETVVPTVIQETKPVYQKIVEGPVYSQEVLSARGVRSTEEMELEAQLNAYKPSTEVIAPVRQSLMLPTQIIEKPAAVHESIRKELLEEIQPVVNVEKVKTEVHQVTQPLFDKEIRPVFIEKKILSTEILPEVLVEGRGLRTAEEFSTTQFMPSSTMVVEKPATFIEVERKQIIEEIQPVIYKETIVPTVIQETKPVYQKIVEGPVYSQETLAARGVRSTEEIQRETQMNAYRPSTEVIAPIHQEMLLPTQIVEKPVAVHEEIRKELIEEIQPVVNIEKLQTEIHQVTQPLFDKEVRPVSISQKTLAQEYLPEVRVEGRGIRAVDDLSTVQYLDTKTVVIEKAAMFHEIERTQIIEEIQPVVYKETIMPTVIQETKPMYQKIVEGAVYSHETLAPQSVSEWKLRHPGFTTTTTTTSMTSTSSGAASMSSSTTSSSTSYTQPKFL